MLKGKPLLKEVVQDEYILYEFMQRGYKRQGKLDLEQIIFEWADHAEVTKDLLGLIELLDNSSATLPQVMVAINKLCGTLEKGAQDAVEHFQEQMS